MAVGGDRRLLDVIGAITPDRHRENREGLGDAEGCDQHGHVLAYPVRYATIIVALILRRDKGGQEV